MKKQGAFGGTNQLQSKGNGNMVCNIKIGIWH